MVIKEIGGRENPFADYGTIVVGDRFVGRKYEFSIIHDRVLQKNYGNISIVGLPRIGKSSLAWNALMADRGALLKERKIIVVHMNLGSIKTSSAFYERMVQRVGEAIKGHDSDLYTLLRKEAVDVEDFNGIENFFYLIKSHSYRAVIILDEFDHSNSIFDVCDYQMLRELSTMPDTRLCLVTVSRNTLQEIEKRSGGISNFYGIFKDMRLGMYDADHDMPLYWEWVESNGISVSEAYKKDVSFYAGRHPFLMDLLNYSVYSDLVSTNAPQESVSELVGANIRSELWNQYDKILLIAEEERLKRALIQKIIGPDIDANFEDVEKLVKYDLLSLSPDEASSAYKTISQHFADYLKQKELEFDIWPLWNHAEQSLRDMVNGYLIINFGEQWISSFINKYPKQKSNIVKYQKIMEDNKLRFGEMASENLLRYTYPLDIWESFIQSDWNYFQIILGGGIKEWSEKFLLLSRIRNPLAHSNKDFVNPDDIERAKLICEQIIDKCSNSKAFD